MNVDIDLDEPVLKKIRRGRENVGVTTAVKKDNKSCGKSSTGVVRAGTETGLHCTGVHFKSFLQSEDM